jgi:hypothetical protein
LNLSLDFSKKLIVEHKEWGGEKVWWRKKTGKKMRIMMKRMKTKNGETDQKKQNNFIFL